METYCYVYVCPAQSKRGWGQTGKVGVPSQSHSTTASISAAIGNRQDLDQLSDPEQACFPDSCGGLCVDLIRWAHAAYSSQNYQPRLNHTGMLPDQEGVTLRKIWSSPQLPWCAQPVSIATSLTSRVWALYWAGRHTPLFLLMPLWPNCPEIYTNFALRNFFTYRGTLGLSEVRYLGQVKSFTW